MDLRLFFSWQSDTDSKKLHHTDFIRTCIKSAISRVNKELKYVNIIYQEGMKGASGTREMIPEIEVLHNNFEGKKRRNFGNDS